MSGQGGVYLFDGGPAPEGFLAALAEGLAARAPDGGAEAERAGVHMVWRGFHTDRDSWSQQQPLIGSAGEMITWDGRLDNRDDLRDRLDLDRGWTGSDAGLVLAAYRKWGLDFLARLIGDFALCLWDGEERRLLLARDPFGTRPLFYSATAQHVMWSSEIGPLASYSGTTDVDEEYVASYLTSTESPGRTPYRDILSVGPGTAVVFRERRAQTRSFWSLDPGREIVYGSDHEYEDHFLELFREAVKCRLRADGLVMAELSGGLDSSSIVGMADDILHREAVDASGLETVSYLYDESPGSDEGAYVALVEAQRGATGHHILESQYPLLCGFPEDAAIDAPTPLHCFAPTYDRVRELMHARGSRVLLCGQGGDHLFMDEAVFYPLLCDLALQRRFRELYQLARTWARVERKTQIELLWKGVVWPLLPLSVRVRMTPHQFSVPAWFDRGFAARLKCRERLLQRDGVKGAGTPSWRRQHTLVQDAISLVSACYYHERGCMEVTYPYLHRPLVEYMMAIPMSQKLRPGENRSLQRRAMKRLLPEKIAQRIGKRGPDEAAYRAFIREWPRLKRLTSGHACARGYLDADELRRAFQLVRHGVDVQMQPMLRALSLELWLNALAVRTGIGLPSGKMAPPAMQAAAPAHG